MPLSPPLVLEAGSGTKFQLLPLFNIVGPFLGLTKNLGARQSHYLEFGGNKLPINVFIPWAFPMNQKLHLIHAMSQYLLLGFTNRGIVLLLIIWQEGILIEFWGQWFLSPTWRRNREGIPFYLSSGSNCFSSPNEVSYHPLNLIAHYGIKVPVSCHVLWGE
jgi:hypothetical protein